MLQETLAAYRREIAALQERNHKMIATTQQQEHIIHTMSHELRQATEKLALEEVGPKKRTSLQDHKGECFPVDLKKEICVFYCVA